MTAPAGKRSSQPRSQSASLTAWPLSWRAGFIIGLLAWSLVLVWQTLIHFPWNTPLLPYFSLERFRPFPPQVFVGHWLSTLKNTGLLAGWILSSHGWGRLLMDRAFPAGRSRLDRALYSLGLGFSLWSLLIFILGVFGLFQPGLFAVLWTGLVLAGGWLTWRVRRELAPAPGWLLGRRAAWPDRLLAVLVLAYLGLVFLCTNTPEIFYDSLVYHLADPVQWILHGGFSALPHNFFSNLPMNTEMLYTGSLMLSDERLCRMLHAVLSVLAGLAAFSLGRRWFGRRVGFWAAAIFLTVPLVALNMMASGIDVAAAFYSLLAVACLTDWIFSTDQNAVPGRLLRGALLTGCFIGAALGSKYITAFMLVPACLSAGVVAGPRRWLEQGRWKEILALAVGCLFMTMPWFIKSAVVTGNPVYPFLYKVIPSRYIDADKMQQQMDGFREYGQRSVMQFLRQPWDLTFYFPTSNSFLGSVFLFLGPGLIFLAVGWRRGPPVRNFFLLTVLLSLLIWSSQTQITRYLIPALGLLAILCALAMEKMEHLHAVAGRWVRWVALLLVVIHSGLLAGIVMGNFDPMGYALGLETRSVYLQKHLLTDYEPMAEIVNQLAGPVKVMLVGEGRAYYFHKPVVSATVYNASPFITLLDQSTSAEQAWQGLRREGYTHLLIAYQEAARTRGYERYLWTEASLGRLQELYARYLKPVKDNGTLALYEIVQTPQTGQPVKKGRPLFTYAPDAVAKANSHMYQGYQALQQGQEMQAMAEWQRCLELAPEWEIPYLQLGWLYLKVGRPEDALQMFRQADGLASLDPSTYNNLGALEMQKGRPEEAKRCFQLALQGDPNLGKARENLEQLERTKAGR